MSHKRKGTFFPVILGAIGSSKESINNLMGSSKKGQVGILVVGGSEEAMNANPGRTDLVLKNRKGFAKIALRNG